MIRFLFRFTGLWLLAGSFVVLVIDGTRSVSASRLLFAPVRDAWAIVAASNLEQTQKSLAGGLFEPLFSLFLSMPFFALLAVIGLLFLAIGRRRRENLVGYSSRR